VSVGVIPMGHTRELFSSHTTDRCISMRESHVRLMQCISLSGSGTLSSHTTNQQCSTMRGSLMVGSHLSQACIQATDTRKARPLTRGEASDRTKTART
jgi:uncharacterized protein YceK